MPQDLRSAKSAPRRRPTPDREPAGRFRGGDGASACDPAQARARIRALLREMGDVIRETRAPELGWLSPPRALWPDAPAELLGLKDRAEQRAQGGEPTVRVIRAQPSPEAIDRAERLIERVRQFPKHQAIVVIGFGCRIHMGKLAAHREVRVSRQHAWALLGGACDVLAREGW